MNYLPLLLGILMILASSGTGAQETAVQPDQGRSLPELEIPILEGAVDTIIMSPAERATIACLKATDKVMAFSGGRAIEITIGLPDADLLEVLDVATKSIGRAAPSVRTDAPPTPQLPASDVDYEVVRNLLSPSGDWSAEIFRHLSRLKGQVARLVVVAEATEELGAASRYLIKAAEVTDDRPWPDERSIIMYLERPEACNSALLGSFFEATVGYVGERIKGLDILGSVARILLAVDTRTSDVHPLSSLSFDEVCGGTDGIGADGVVCGFRFHRLLFPFYADREVEVGPGRITGEALRNTHQFDVLVGRAGDVARERREVFAGHARSDSEAVLPKLLALVSLFESEHVELTAFRTSLDKETLALEEMAQEIILRKDRLTEIAREIATLNTDLTTLEARLDDLDEQRQAARDSFDNARKALDDARAALSRLGSTCEEAGMADCGTPAGRETYNQRKHDAYESVNTALNAYLDLQKGLLELNEQYFEARQEKSELLTTRGALLVERSVADVKVGSLEIQHAQRSAVLRINEGRYDALWPAHVEDLAALEKALALSRELANSSR